LGVFLILLCAEFFILFLCKIICFLMLLYAKIFFCIHISLYAYTCVYMHVCFYMYKHMKTSPDYHRRLMKMIFKMGVLFHSVKILSLIFNNVELLNRNKLINMEKQLQLLQSKQQKGYEIFSKVTASLGIKSGKILIILIIFAC
jgi:hypothetical protein